MRIVTEFSFCRETWCDEHYLLGPEYKCPVHHGEFRTSRYATLSLQVPDLGPVHVAHLQPGLQAAGEQGAAGRCVPGHPEPVPVRLAAPEAVSPGQLAGGGAGLADPVIRALRHLLPHLLQAEGHHCRQQAPEVDKEGGGQIVHPLSPYFLVTRDVLRDLQATPNICDTYP